MELLFRNVAVIGFQSLFSLQLFAVVGHFFLAGAVLSRTVFAFQQRALGIAPQVGVQAAVCFFLALTILFIKFILKILLHYCPGSLENNLKRGATYPHFRKVSAIYYSLFENQAFFHFRMTGGAISVFTFFAFLRCDDAARNNKFQTFFHRHLQKTTSSLGTKNQKAGGSGWVWSV